jgi:hypothetical protein
MIDKMLSDQRRLLKVRAKQRRKRDKLQRKQERRDRKDHIASAKARKAAKRARARYDNRRLGIKHKPSRCCVIVQDGQLVEYAFNVEGSTCSTWPKPASR